MGAYETELQSLPSDALHFYNVVLTERWLVDYKYSELKAMWYLLDVLQFSEIGGFDKQTSGRGSEPRHVAEAQSAGFCDPSGSRSEQVCSAPSPLCTGFKISAYGVGCPPKPAPRLECDEAPHIFECYNGNSWGTLKERLGRTTALVVFKRSGLMKNVWEPGSARRRV